MRRGCSSVPLLPSSYFSAVLFRIICGSSSYSALTRCCDFTAVYWEFTDSCLHRTENFPSFPIRIDKVTSNLFLFGPSYLYVVFQCTPTLPPSANAGLHAQVAVQVVVLPSDSLFRGPRARTNRYSFLPPAISTENSVMKTWPPPLTLCSPCLVFCIMRYWAATQIIAH